jgi:hypothetical protein
MCGVVGLMEEAEMSGVGVGRCGGGWGEEEAVCEVATHSHQLACLEPTRAGVGSPGIKIESEVVSKQEPEV